MRVIAVESLDDGVLSIYGEGEYIGKKVPSSGFFSDIGLRNPCIKLDSGQYVWGYQCWWADIDAFNKAYKDVIKETIVVEIPEIVSPKEE